MATDVVIENIQCFTDTSDITELVYRLTKQDIFDIMHPVDEVYTQYPLMPDPQTLYNTNDITSVWVEINYSGAFFRSEGGKSDPFISSGTITKQSSQMINHNHKFPHTHNMNHYHDRGNMNIKGGLVFGGKDDSTDMAVMTGAFKATASYGHRFKTKNGAYFRYGDFTASSGWTGSTSEASKTDTNDVSVNTTYDGNSNIREARPENLTIKIWRRTS